MYDSNYNNAKDKTLITLFLCISKLFSKQKTEELYYIL